MYPDHLLVRPASVIETSGDQTAGFEMAGGSLVQLGGQNMVEVSVATISYPLALSRITPSPGKYLPSSTYLICAATLVVHKRSGGCRLVCQVRIHHDLVVRPYATIATISLQVP